MSYAYFAESQEVITILDSRLESGSHKLRDKTVVSPNHTSIYNLSAFALFSFSSNQNKLEKVQSYLSVVMDILGNNYQALPLGCWLGNVCSVELRAKLYGCTPSFPSTGGITVPETPSTSPLSPSSPPPSPEGGMLMVWTGVKATSRLEISLTPSSTDGSTARACTAFFFPLPLLFFPSTALFEDFLPLPLFLPFPVPLVVPEVAPDLADFFFFFRDPEVPSSSSMSDSSESTSSSGTCFSSPRRVSRSPSHGSMEKMAVRIWAFEAI